MNATIKKTIKLWHDIFPYVQIPRNESEYEKLLNFVDELMEFLRHQDDERVTSLLKLVAKNIEQYETIHYPTKSPSPREVLEFLMEEHRLTQNDLPEIGSQSLVSKILSGERQLTVPHIQNLSKRFGVSPTVFIGNDKTHKFIRKKGILSNPFSQLREKMSPAAQKIASAKAKRILKKSRYKNCDKI